MKGVYGIDFWKDLEEQTDQVRVSRSRGWYISWLIFSFPNYCFFYFFKCLVKRIFFMLRHFFLGALSFSVTAWRQQKLRFAKVKRILGSFKDFVEHFLVFYFPFLSFHIVVVHKIFSHTFAIYAIVSWRHKRFCLWSIWMSWHQSR